MFATTGDTRLEPRYQAGHMFFVDSVAALADAQQGRAPQGEFAALVDLLTRQFAGAAAARIRRANFLDLAAQALESCRRRLDEAMPAIENLRTAIDQQRGELSSALAGQIRGELLSARRPWENRLLGQVTSRWGFSPFSLVLRLYQGIGGLASGALLYRRGRRPSLPCGASSKARARGRNIAATANCSSGPARRRPAVSTPTQLRRAAVVLEGYAAEAGLPKASASARDPRSRGRRGQLELRRPLVAGPRRPDRPAGPTAHGLVHPLALRDPASGHAGLSALPAGEEFLLRFLVVGHARADVGRGVVYRRGLLAGALVFPVALALHAAFAGRAQAGHRPPGRELDRGRGRLRRLRRVGRRLPPGRRVPAGSGDARRRRGTVAGKGVNIRMEPTKELGDQLYREEVLAARAMTPEQRMLAGAELFEFACKIAAAGIRNQYPGASEEEVAQRLAARLELQRRLEQCG